MDLKNFKGKSPPKNSCHSFSPLSHAEPSYSRKLSKRPKLVLTRLPLIIRMNGRAGNKMEKVPYEEIQ